MELFKLNQNRLNYLILSLVGSVFLFIKSAVYAHILRVDEFGHYSKYIALANFLIIFIGLGSQFFSQVKLPECYSRKDTASVEALLSNSLVTGFLICFLTLTVSGIGLLYSDDRHFLFSVDIAIAYTYSQYIFLIYLIRLKSAHDFLGHAWVSFMRALLLVLLGCTAAWFSGDAFWVLVTEMATTFLYFTKSALKRGFIVFLLPKNLDSLSVRIKNHVKQSMRFLLLNASIIVLLTMDRWLGGYTLSNKEFGVYSFGLIILAVFDLLQLILNNAIFPIMAKKIANDDWISAKKLCNLLFISIVLTGLITWYPIVYVLKILITEFYIEYTELNELIWIFVYIGFVRLSNFYGNLTLLLRKELQVTLWYLLFSAVCFSMYILFYKNGMGIVFFLYLSLVISLVLLVFNKIFSSLHNKDLVKI